MRLSLNPGNHGWHILSCENIHVYFDEVEFTEYSIMLKRYGESCAMLNTDSNEEFKMLWSESK